MNAETVSEWQMVTSSESESCKSLSSDNLRCTSNVSPEQHDFVMTTTDDEQSADDVDDSGSASSESSPNSSSLVSRRKRRAALPEEEEESSCSSPKDDETSSPSLPDYCRTLRITDAHGHVRELVFPRGLDLDRPKRARTTFSAEQLDQLEREFVRNPYLVGQERTQLSHKLQLSETQVKVWFQNRRTKQKREQQRACDQRQSSAEGVAASNVLRLLQEQTSFRFTPIQKGNPFLPLPPFTT